MQYHFYGWQTADCQPVNGAYPMIHNPRDLYDLLSKIWCAETCAPRMRQQWNVENKTMGQCSITAFLAQDLFGGEVYGIRTENGNVHCFNVIGDRIFDLTSEQFGGKTLCYTACEKQSRTFHLAKQEKYERYQILKHSLQEICE